MFNPSWLLFLMMNSAVRGVLVLVSIFWIWVLIDCLVKEPSDTNDKVAWMLFILFVPPVGALVYYFIRRPERVKLVGR